MPKKTVNKSEDTARYKVTPSGVDGMPTERRLCATVADRLIALANGCSDLRDILEHKKFEPLKVQVEKAQKGTYKKTIETLNRIGDELAEALDEDGIKVGGIAGVWDGLDSKNVGVMKGAPPRGLGSVTKSAPKSAPTKSANGKTGGGVPARKSGGIGTGSKVALTKAARKEYADILPPKLLNGVFVVQAISKGKVKCTGADKRPYVFETGELASS